MSVPSLEAERTRELLHRFLPRPPAVILDIGGAEGAYALLLLGPLYHLIEAADRHQALREAARVLRPGGVLFAAAISRFASAVDGVCHGTIADAQFEAIVEGDIRYGIHDNPDPVDRPEWFTLAYFHHPNELRQEA